MQEVVHEGGGALNASGDVGFGNGDRLGKSGGPRNELVGVFDGVGLAADRVPGNYRIAVGRLDGGFYDEGGIRISRGPARASRIGGYSGG